MQTGSFAARTSVTRLVGAGRIPVLVVALVVAAGAIAGARPGSAAGDLGTAGIAATARIAAGSGSENPATSAGSAGQASDPAVPTATPGPPDVLGGPAHGSAAAGLPDDLNPDCLNSADPVARADELMANVYRLGAHPAVSLPANLRWTENPLGDANWQFQLHSMRYVLDLLASARITGRADEAKRAAALVRDWLADNPRDGAPSIWAWNDHSTAQRAIVLSCMADLAPMTGWLRAALTGHGRTLADPAFYRKEGNHALNQDIALLETGRVLRRADWIDLAGDRINALILDSVDVQGVTNEQSIGYEDFNYRRYRLAETRMLAVGLRPSAAFARIDRMPAFLAQATIPSGSYALIGDTSAWPADAIAGTAAEYAATAGARGPKPTATVARYAAGYLFARSGWGEHRAPADETFFSLKWGPGPVFHGHVDGLNLTLAAWGARLLEDPGPYAYGGGAYRGFFKSRRAHNVVTVDGSTWTASAATRLVSFRQGSRLVDVRLTGSGDPGVTQTRRVTWSRSLDYLLVEDDLTSGANHTYRQLWHLGADAAPVVGAAAVRTTRDRGNVLIRQLVGDPGLRIVTGATDPIQGWLSHRPDEKVPAPVVEAIQHGRSIRYLTLIVPAEGRPDATVSGLRLTPTGYAVTITIGSRSERVLVDGSSVTIRDAA